VVTARIARDKLVELSQLGVRKIFMKPLKIDQLWQSVGELLGTKIPLDETPCILDAHVNENVIFVEVAMGLNLEKINLLDFKISELMTIHNLELPKILVMLSAVDFKEADAPKLRRLFEILINLTRGRVKWIKVLTQSKSVEQTLRGFWELSDVTITESLEKAMDELLEKANLEGFVKDSETSGTTSLEMRFDNDAALEVLSTRMQAEGGDLHLAVVDDDFIVQEIIKNTFVASGATVATFDDGQNFLDAIPPDLDLLFLDLMMPRVNGFEVLDKLKELGFTCPIIVLSALSRRETVLKAMSYGIRSYITKPLKPDDLLRKAYEIVGSHF
jgi:CheY-like chemotaxis protein